MFTVLTEDTILGDSSDILTRISKLVVDELVNSGLIEQILLELIIHVALAVEWTEQAVGRNLGRSAITTTQGI